LLGLPSAALAAITAPAIAVALSPIPAVIALVLLIHNHRPRASSIVYLLGRSTALALLVTASVNVPHLGGYLHKPLPHWTHWVTVAIGVAFIVLGALVWRRRPSAPTTSQWLTQVGGIPPPAAAALGLLPALVNPKVVAASVVAGGQISVLPSTVDAAIAFAYYLAMATVTVAAPVITYLALGSRIDPRLERLRHWVQRHHIAATATTLIIIGVTILLYGLS
jgi:hypothetical protein